MRLGIAQLKGESLYETVKGLKENTCVQVFLGEKTSLYPKDLAPMDKVNTMIFCNKNCCKVYFHSPYTANLAKENADTSFSCVCKELKNAEPFGGSSVLHIGNNGKGGSIQNVSKCVNQAREQGYLSGKSTLLLENAAGQGNELGKSLEEIRLLFEGIDNTENVGICLDTQHSFASGMCDFSSHESVVKMFEGIRAYGKVPLVHINDSEKEYNSRKDRHQVVGEGYIWGKDKTSLESLVSICDQYEIDMVSETKDPLKDIITLGEIRKKIAKE